jgi:hypothetical protein
MHDITLEQWKQKYDKKAVKDGWSLFDDLGLIAIQRIDKAENGHCQLATDADAIRRVFTQAAEGNPVALTALFLDGKNVHEQTDTDSPKEEKHFLPKGCV